MKHDKLFSWAGERKGRELQMCVCVPVRRPRQCCADLHIKFAVKSKGHKGELEGEWKK